jgi:hypothetical protein
VHNHFNSGDDMKCHICEAETDFTCDGCFEPVCFDCCTPMTIHNQIDYPLCSLCNDMKQDEAARYYHEQDKKKEQIEKIKSDRKAKRRANWYKSENIERRRIRLEQRRKERRELRIKQMEEAVKIVSEMFKGMF